MTRPSRRPLAFPDAVDHRLRSLLFLTTTSRLSLRKQTASQSVPWRDEGILLAEVEAGVRERRLPLAWDAAYTTNSHPCAPRKAPPGRYLREGREPYRQRRSHYDALGTALDPAKEGINGLRRIKIRHSARREQQVS
jgi:hypothetical protein